MTALTTTHFSPRQSPVAGITLSLFLVTILVECSGKTEQSVIPRDAATNDRGPAFDAGTPGPGDTGADVPDGSDRNEASGFHCGQRRWVHCMLPDGSSGTTSCYEGFGYTSCRNNVACRTESLGPFKIDKASCEIVGVDEVLRDAGVTGPPDSYLSTLNIAVKVGPSSVPGEPWSARLADPYRVDPTGCGDDYGWYVDQDMTPRVYLCPRNCAPLPASTTADVLLGCDSLWRELAADAGR
jgi:hypothetical protein